jgi:pimeloyl-ACP methyl ester carboxylesterase
MTPASVSTTVQKLMPVCRRVLQQPLIGPDDNFFDLGGDPERAFDLFAEISREWGRELSPLFIYQAPTVLAIADLLEQACPPQLSPVVLLKAGISPPIFVAHGLGGNLMEVFELTKHIRSSHSVYGLQAQGLDGVGQPLERVEDMARIFIDPMKQLQPRGPYRLVGYSFGGLVMLEIAQRLSRSGEKIALLAMLDTYPRGWQLSLRYAAGKTPHLRNKPGSDSDFALAPAARSGPSRAGPTAPRHRQNRPGAALWILYPSHAAG